MRKIIGIAVLLTLLPVAAHLLSGCGSLGTPMSYRLLPSPAPTADPHRYEGIENGELNWSYWPEVVLTPVFGEGA